MASKGAWFDTISVLEDLSNAAAREDVGALALLNLTNKREALAIIGLMEACVELSERDKVTEFGEHLLDTLIRLSEEPQSKNALWKALNLMLTAVAGSIHGYSSDQVSRLRHLNASMDLKDLVRCSKEPHAYVVMEDRYTPFVRTGLALQGVVDVVQGTQTLPEVADMIHLAEGLVEGACTEGGVHLHAWLLLLQKSFRGGCRVDDYNVVIEPLKLILEMLEKDKLATDVFQDIWFSLGFFEVIRVSRLLFQKTSSTNQLLYLLIKTRTCIDSLWNSDDPAAMEESKMLVHDLCESVDKLAFDLVLTATTAYKTEMVVEAVKLYILLLLKFTRHTKTPYFLPLHERDLAKNWLLGLEEQALRVILNDTSEVDKEALCLQDGYKRAAVAVRLGLLITEKPEEYKFGVPS